VKVAGIDTSLTSTGIAVIADRPLTVGGLDSLVVTTMCIESSSPKRVRGDKTPVTIQQRRERIARIVDEVADAVLPVLDLAVIEAPSYGSQGASTWDRAWLWGAVIERLMRNGVPVAIVAPRCRALWAAGSGAASKSPVAVHLSRMWPAIDPGISDDEWDGLALASMGAQQLGLVICELARHREQLAKVAWPDFPAGIEMAS
jgi:Holliday junction resolvasome RuvABC endonuclease subunit